jgi:type VI secretion system protein ImpG
MAVREDLLLYYERELAFLRRMGAEFASTYPKVAARLQLEPSKCEDPHVERLLEAFAFLAARVHLKVDDDFPEVSEALLDVLYPHFVRPIPSMSLVQFQLDPEKGKLATGFPIAKETQLTSRSVARTQCRFRTVGSTTVWPLNVANAKWTTPDRLQPAVRAPDAVAALRFELRCLPDIQFAKLSLDTLRLHLDGERSFVYTLYELLSNNVLRVLFRDPRPGGDKRTITLPASTLSPAGFEPDEAMLPAPRRAFGGYQLLQEYFTFPEKFLFFDLAGFDAVRAAGFGDRVEVVIMISPFERADRRPMLEAGVSDKSLKLGCAPIVNLFPLVSEPIQLTGRRAEYEIDPDARRRQTTEIFSVEEVLGLTPGGGEPVRFQPFYSHRHGTDTAAPRFWRATRRPSVWRPDNGTDVFLSFADLSGDIATPSVDAISARLTCFNADLPSRLPFGDESPGGDFEMRGAGPIRRIACLIKPTPAIQPGLGRQLLWRLVSMLSLNYLSLTDEGVDALRELLRLHNAGDNAAMEKQIQGVLSVRGATAYSRVASEHGLSFARGRRVEVEFDEDQFAGSGVYLLATVLERFLGLYASMNSFCALTAKSRQRHEVIRAWPPRSGWKSLL